MQLKWHDPKATADRGPRVAAATAGSARSSRRCGASGGTFQEWSEHFGLDLWLEAMADHGLDLDWYVYRHRTEDEVLPWDHISAGLHKDFLWQDWRDALAEVGLPDCRWTPCYDCGACTGYGIEHVVASATPPAGGSQGTGQDLVDRAPARRRARHAARPPAGRSPVMTERAGHEHGPMPRVRLRFAKLGKVRFTSHRDVARIWERALRRAGVAVAYTEGFSPRPKLSFGLALSTGHESSAEYLDVDPARGAGRRRPSSGCPRCSPRSCPRASRCSRPVALPAGADSLQQAVTSCTWHIEVGRHRPARRRRRRGPGAGRHRARRRPASARARPSPTTSGPPSSTCGCSARSPRSSHRWRPAGDRPRHGARGRAGHPAACASARSSSSRPSTPTWVEARVTRIHQWTQAGGARREVLDLGPAATPPPHAEARAS